MTDRACIEVRGAREKNLKDISLDIPKRNLPIKEAVRRPTGQMPILHGPEGGSAGGEVLFEGPPHALKNCSRSLTARFI